MTFNFVLFCGVIFVLAALFGGFMFFLIVMKELIHLLWGVIRGKLVWVKE